jgi:hypothetical protein
VVVAVPVEPEVEQLVALVLIQTYQEQLLCTAVAVPDQVQILDLYLQVEEVMTIHQQQIEVAEDRNPQEVAV